MTDELVPQNAQVLSSAEMQDKIDSLEQQVQRLSIELDALEERVPDSNIISPNFFKQAFTVWGHYVVAGFIIAIPIMCFSVMLAFVFGLFSQY